VNNFESRQGASEEIDQVKDCISPNAVMKSAVRNVAFKSTTQRHEIVKNVGICNRLNGGNLDSSIKSRDNEVEHFISHNAVLKSPVRCVAMKSTSPRHEIVKNVGICNRLDGGNSGSSKESKVDKCFEMVSSLFIMKQAMLFTNS